MTRIQAAEYTERRMTMEENRIPDVSEKSPWERAMGRVLMGIILTSFTFSFWCLDHILPAIGTVLMVLGFRALRKENPWFRSGYLLAAVRAWCVWVTLILNTTILPGLSSQGDGVWVLVSLALALAEFFCLWRGFRAVRQRAGLPPRAESAAGLMAWYGGMYLLAAIHYQGLLIVVGMIISLVLILRSLYKQVREAAEAGAELSYSEPPAGERRIVLALVLILSVGGACGYLFGGRYPMEWEEKPPVPEDLEKTRDRLLELGFPEYVLNDLSREDIRACDGAFRVVVDVSDQMVSEGWKRTMKYNEEEGRLVEEAYRKEKELRLTGVAVRIPGERETWRIFHHFQWMSRPSFHGTESLQIWPVYRDIREGWQACGEVTGQVLYEKDGMRYRSPYYFLGSQTAVSDTFFWGRQENTDVFAAFSMPRQGDAWSGYVAYPACELQDGYIISSWFNYTHQRRWFQYPVMTAMEKRMSNGWNRAGAFITVQSALQFDPNEDTAGEVGGSAAVPMALSEN